MTRRSAPIELNDDELLAVSGGAVVVVGIAQAILQEAAVVQYGGILGIGGGNGTTSFSGNLSFSQSFNGSITQTATNTNSGSVAAAVAASGSTVTVGIAQGISQAAAIYQVGGSLGIGGGNGATAVTGNLTFTQGFAASIEQEASNVNSGSVTAGVAAT